MQKQKFFGQLIILFNVLYCFAMAVLEALQGQSYVFLSDYFIAGAVLAVLYLNVESYWSTRAATSKSG